MLQRVYLPVLLKTYDLANKNESEVRKMAVYACSVCGWEYDEEKGAPDMGIEPGTKFEDLPDDFACALCGVGKDQFEQQ